MKRITMLILAVIVLAAASANAEAYTVRRGDCLSKIAVRYHVKLQALHRANKQLISNPDRIYPGQKLQIPEKVLSRATAPAEPFSWKNPGQNKFGQRDFVKAISLLNLPQEVKTLLIAEVNSGRFEWHQIQSGDHFEQMVFGNYRVVGDVNAQWNSSRMLAAKKYSVSHENSVYYLIDPLICRNWAWWAEKKEQEIKPPAAEPPVVVEKPPTPEKPKPPMLLIPPVEPPPEVPPPIAEEKCQSSWESWAFAGHFVGAQEQNRHDWSEYWGVYASFFPCSIPLADGSFKAGPSVKYVGWRGEAGEAVKYFGEMALLGAEAQYLRPNTKTSLKAYGGFKRGNVQGIGFPYDSSEKYSMLAVEGTHQIWGVGKRSWFDLWEFGFAIEQNLGSGEKNTYLNNQRIDDPPTSQGLYSGRIKTEIYQGEYAIPTFELGGGYRGFDQSLYAAIRPGVKLWGKAAEVDVSYNWIEGPQNNMAGIHAMLDIGETLKKIINAFAGSGKEQVPVEMDLAPK